MNKLLDYLAYVIVWTSVISMFGVLIYLFYTEPISRIFSVGSTVFIMFLWAFSRIENIETKGDK